MKAEKERKAFEEWYEKAYLNTDIGYLMHNGQYSSRRKQHSWDAWQASANREGYKFVPLEASKACLSNLGDVIFDNFGTTVTEVDRCAEKAYKAMIGACDAE